MKNLELKSSLIKSGIILILCIFFIYAFAVGDSGGVTGTISSLFSGAVFFIGLLLALVFSVIVMFAIYFGILAMYGGDVCNKTYDELKSSLRNSTGTLSKTFSTDCCRPKESFTGLRAEDLIPITNEQQSMKTGLGDISNSVTTLEKGLSTLSSSITTITEELNSVKASAETFKLDIEEKVNNTTVEESIAKLSSEMTSIQSTLASVASKLPPIEESISSLSAEKPSEADTVQELIAQSVKGIQKDIQTLKTSMDTLAVTEKPAEKGTADTDEHRILSYFSKKGDAKKFVKLVEEAVGKDMTYAQVGEFLDDALPAEVSEVLADHPSLTKDYIRTCRQKA